MVAARYWPETDEEDDSEQQTGKGDGKSNVGHNTQGLTLNLKKKNGDHNQSLKPKEDSSFGRAVLSTTDTRHWVASLRRKSEAKYTWHYNS